MSEGARVGWILKVDNEVKLNLMQDRSSIGTLLEEVKDGNPKCSK